MNSIFLWLTFLGLDTLTLAQQNNVLEFEKDRVQATLTADTSALSRMLSTDLIWIHSGGKKDSKDSYIRALAEKSVRYKVMYIEESDAKYFDAIAITTGILSFISLTADGKENANRIRFTCVYKKWKDSWQVINWHATHLKQ
jgi:hypothetical protein